MTNYNDKTRDELIQVILDLTIKLYSLENQIEEEAVFDCKLKKKKRDILYLLNNRSGYRAKEETLQRYGISYDDELGIWILND